MRTRTGYLFMTRIKIPYSGRAASLDEQIALLKKAGSN
jgi:hypothetical protein